MNDQHEPLIEHAYVECTGRDLFAVQGPHCSAHCGRSKWDDIHKVGDDAPVVEEKPAA